MKNKLLISLILLISTLSARSQERKPFSASVALGPNYYFNNLEIFHDNVRSLNYSTYARILWNTQYRLSFGIETGLIKLYRVNDIAFDANAGSSITAIPLHIAIQMRVYNHLYASGSFGPTILRSTITSSRGENVTGTTSIADLSLAFGYKYSLGTNTSLGAELKYFYSSKAEDRNLALPISLEINF